MDMHTNVILTNKRRIHAKSNYTNTKLKAWFRRLLLHQARKRTGSILRRCTPGLTRGISRLIDGVFCVGRACHEQTRDAFQPSRLTGARLWAVITLQTLW